jgi:hypothetical protein
MSNTNIICHHRPGPCLYIAKNKQYGGNIKTLGFTKMYIIDNSLIKVVYMYNDCTSLSRNEYVVFEYYMKPQILKNNFEHISNYFSRGFGVVNTGSLAEYNSFKNEGIEYLKELR